MPLANFTNLDFDQVKSTLREYLKENSNFTDYDFEGSVLSNILDVLAYNTYYTAFNTNMAINELFIDSATLRDNVIAIARQLGYRPRSTTSSTASSWAIIKEVKNNTESKFNLINFIILPFKI